MKSNLKTNPFREIGFCLKNIEKHFMISCVNLHRVLKKQANKPWGDFESAQMSHFLPCCVQNPVRHLARFLFAANEPCANQKMMSAAGRETCLIGHHIKSFGTSHPRYNQMPNQNVFRIPHKSPGTSGTLGRPFAWCLPPDVKDKQSRRLLQPVLASTIFVG